MNLHFKEGQFMTDEEKLTLIQKYEELPAKEEVMRWL